MWQKKTKIKTAVENNRVDTLRKFHLTTSDYYHPYVSKFMECVPGSKQKIKLHDLVLLRPQLTKIMGAATMKHMLYFVPMRLVQRSWLSFIDGELYPYEDTVVTPTNVRRFKMSDLKDIYTLATQYTVNPFVKKVGSTNDPYDFIRYDSDTSLYQPYIFKDLGKRLNNILVQLGYRIDWLEENDDYYISAMPLLAFAKLYLDHMRNTAYAHITEYMNVETILNRNSSTNQDLDSNDIVDIINLIEHVNYDNDIFTSAFDNPNGPNGASWGQQFNIGEIDPHILATGTYSEVETIAGSAYIKGNQNANTRNISQYILTALHKLTDFMHRHQIVGHNKLMNYLAQYGVIPKSENINFTQFIGKCETKINFDQIFSTADTDGANVGTYAGRGWGYQDGEFTFETDEFGYLFDIAVLVPEIGYYQGVRKHIYHVNRLDFWNPTFDSMGNTPVMQSEVFVPQNTVVPQEANHDQFRTYNRIFGYLPRYYEYKEDMNELSGDFQLHSMHNEMDKYHLFRKFLDIDFEDLNGANFNIVHGLRFVQTRDKARYDRGFITEKNDNFIIITNYETEYSSPMKALYDSYDYESVGKEIDVELQGTNKITKF